MSTPEHHETPATDEGGEQKDPAWYRDQIERKDAQLAEQTKTINRQRVALMEQTFETVGLDPAVGLGKAIAEKYDGEPDADALRQFAIDEYQWEPPAPVENEIVAGQERVNTAVAGTERVDQRQIDLDIADAESRGDFASAVALKLAKFRQEQGI